MLAVGEEGRHLSFRAGPNGWSKPGSLMYSACLTFPPPDQYHSAWGLCGQLICPCEARLSVPYFALNWTAVACLHTTEPRPLITLAIKSQIRRLCSQGVQTCPEHCFLRLDLYFLTIKMSPYCTPLNSVACIQLLSAFARADLQRHQQ